MSNEKVILVTTKKEYDELVRILCSLEKTRERNRLAYTPKSKGRSKNYKPVPTFAVIPNGILSS